MIRVGDRLLWNRCDRIDGIPELGLQMNRSALGNWFLIAPTINKLTPRITRLEISQKTVKLGEQWLDQNLSHYHFTLGLPLLR